MPKLRAERLSRYFESVKAVDGLDLEVREGEIVGLLGPNGAGKTTALRMLAGVLVPTAGRVFVGEQEVTREPMAVKKQIGFLSGNTRLYRRLTGREVLSFFGRLYQMETAPLVGAINHLVRELQMEEFIDRRCDALSSGQTQRVNIARAVIHDPAIFILDEPTVSLDIVTGRFVVEFIRRQRDRGKAVLFSTHIIGEAEYTCDRMALMFHGRVIAVGTGPELMSLASMSNLTDAFLKLTGVEAGLS